MPKGPHVLGGGRIATSPAEVHFATTGLTSFWKARLLHNSQSYIRQCTSCKIGKVIMAQYSEACSHSLMLCGKRTEYLKQASHESNAGNIYNVYDISILDVEKQYRVSSGCSKHWDPNIQVEGRRFLGLPMNKFLI